MTALSSESSEKQPLLSVSTSTYSMAQAISVFELDRFKMVLADRFFALDASETGLIGASFIVSFIQLNHWDAFTSVMMNLPTFLFWMWNVSFIIANMLLIQLIASRRNSPSCLLVSIMKRVVISLLTGFGLGLQTVIACVSLSANDGEGVDLFRCLVYLFYLMFGLFFLLSCSNTFASSRPYLAITLETGLVALIAPHFLPYFGILSVRGFVLAILSCILVGIFTFHERSLKLSLLMSKIASFDAEAGCFMSNPLSGIQVKERALDISKVVDEKKCGEKDILKNEICVNWVNTYILFDYMECDLELPDTNVEEGKISL